MRRLRVIWSFISSLLISEYSLKELAISRRLSIPNASPCNLSPCYLYFVLLLLFLFLFYSSTSRIRFYSLHLIRTTVYPVHPVILYPVRSKSKRITYVCACFPVLFMPDASFYSTHLRAMYEECIPWKV